MKLSYIDLKNKIKEEQKSLALKIKNGKIGRKPSNRNNKNRKDYDNLVDYKWKYRHKHITYCNLFNNTPYNIIEKKSQYNPVKEIINQYKKEWENQLDEVICYST